MNDNFHLLREYLQKSVKNKIPGCVCWLGNKNETFFYESFGYAQIVPKKIKMNKNTIFDLASITKPICTAMSIMFLFEEKEVKLEDQVKKYLPEFKKDMNGEKTIKQLLTHTSGIPAWFPIYILPEEKRVEYLKNANTGRSDVIYSCLGYLVLKMIIERIAHKGFDIFCKDKIFKRLRLKNTFFNPDKSIANVAATELGNKHEKNKASVYGDIRNVRWREDLIKGEAHDGNCYYAYNGVSGNAGLFSSADELAKIMRAYLNGEIVKPDTVEIMTRDYTGGIEKRGLGWWINPYPGLLSESAFGHTGFTGTMVVADPQKDLIIILLANSVHPKVRLGIMPKIRKKVVALSVGV